MSKSLFFNLREAPKLVLGLQKNNLAVNQYLSFYAIRERKISAVSRTQQMLKAINYLAFKSANLIKILVKRKRVAVGYILKNNRLNFSRYYFVGLGYKVYVYRRYLFIWVGLTHYTLILLPPSIKVFAKKKRIYIIGTQRIVFKNFLRAVRSSKKKDIYKGKGLLEIKTYKNFIRMKTGKKKQY